MRGMSRLPDRIPPGPIKLTYEDYVDLPDDGRRYEILDGELEVSPAAAPRHQAVLRDLMLASTATCENGASGTSISLPSTSFSRIRASCSPISSSLPRAARPSSPAG